MYPVKIWWILVHSIRRYDGLKKVEVFFGRRRNNHDTVFLTYHWTHGEYWSSLRLHENVWKILDFGTDKQFGFNIQLPLSGSRSKSSRSFQTFHDDTGWECPILCGGFKYRTCAKFDFHVRCAAFWSNRQLPWERNGRVSFHEQLFPLEPPTVTVGQHD